MAWAELSAALLEPLNQRRENMVRKCFNFIAHGNEKACINELKKRFTAKDNADVVSGKKSESQVKDDFLANF